jgi:hypothetical protein
VASMWRKGTIKSSRVRALSVVAAFVVGVVTWGVMAALADTPVSGAVFTTNVACSGTDLNIYSNKADVYANGGPAHPGAAGLPDGAYYVQVTDPSGATVLGKTLTASVTVSGGAFVQCYQLTAILSSASSGFTALGYDDTPNGGGEYKLWVSQDPTFTNSSTKTDNFKVKTPAGCDPTTQTCGPPPQATLNVIKFYDANANGINDDPAPLITGWAINIHDDIDINRTTPVSVVVDPDSYTVTEGTPLESNWYHTTTNPVSVTVADGDTTTVSFGNVCVGAGGGLTLGFWSNKNGGAILSANSNAILNQVLALHLRKADGSLLGSVSLAVFQKFLTQATATNMANMLSAQLAAMKANVLSGNVSGTALVYVGGSINAFWTVNALMAAADTSLTTDGLTVAASATRTYQETLKSALDQANNNLNFVQATPCAFSFAG